MFWQPGGFSPGRLHGSSTPGSILIAPTGVAIIVITVAMRTRNRISSCFDFGMIPILSKQSNVFSCGVDGWVVVMDFMEENAGDRYDRNELILAASYF